MSATPSGFVPFRITVCGIAELHGHCERGVTHVLSILDPGLDVPPAFGSYGEHARLDLRFDDIIEDMPDKTAPQEAHVEALLAFGKELLAEQEELGDAHLLVHCHMGVSRSTASMALILAQARRDRPAVEALAEVQRIRPVAWPNLRMLEIGDRMLGLDGALVAGVRDIYRSARSPDKDMSHQDWAEFLAVNGRGREVRLMRGE